MDQRSFSDKLTNEEVTLKELQMLCMQVILHLQSWDQLEEEL